MDPFIGEIKMMAFDYAPYGWAKCEGTTMNISQFSALYSLLNTQYGGDGKTNFKLPDLRGRTPLCANTTANGEINGLENVALVTNNIPIHNHMIAVNNTATNANAPKPDSNFLCATKVDSSYPSGFNAFAPAATANKVMNQAAMVSKGGSVAHNNMQPTLVCNFCIALYGVYPMRP